MIARILAGVLSLALAACSGVTVTPPDFSCHTAGLSSINSGSGCQL